MLIVAMFATVFVLLLALDVADYLAARRESEAADAEYARAVDGLHKGGGADATSAGSGVGGPGRRE